MNDSRNSRSLTVLLLIALATGAYFVLRYQGYWAEGDSGVLSIAIAGVKHTGRLIFGRSYSHGPGYPAWSVALADLSGLSVPMLQQVLMPFLGNLLAAILGFAAFRRLLGSERLAALAAGLLFTISYLVFAVSRGSHERVDVSMILIAALAIGSVLQPKEERRSWPWWVIYLLAAFGLSLSNDFFAVVFFLVLTFTTALFTLLAWLRPRAASRAGLLPRAVRRLAFVTLAGWGSWALMLLVYPPARADAGLITSTLGHMLHFLATFQPGSHPFQAAAANYSDLLLYQLTAVPRWVVFLSSFSVLLLQAYAVLRGRSLTLLSLLLAAIYLGYGLFLVAAIPVDFLGLSAGSNVEVRLFTEFAVFSAPLVALAPERFLGWAGRSRAGPPLRWSVLGIVAVFLTPYLLLNWMAATSDPLLSNNWIYYNPAEVQAARFYMTHQQHGNLWIGANPNGRMWAAYAMSYPASLIDPANTISGGMMTAGVTDTLGSPLVTAEAARYHIPLPVVFLGDQVYDNGFAQLYHHVPTTPFQR